MGPYNVFRVLGDLSHLASKLILILSIHRNRSAEGVSLLTQAFYALVFATRYLDLFWVPPSLSWYNFFFKLFYIVSSLYTLALMTRAYPRSREREKAWRLAGWISLGSVVAAPLVTLVGRGARHTSFTEVLWTFSIVLESVAVLPQLLLLRQTTVTTVIDSFYLLALGSYRALYIPNWIVRAVSAEHHFDPIAVVFGVVQTALYVDFAWVYWTRQRVKLRGGGVVDSEDMGRGWLVKRIVGRRSTDSFDEDSEDVEGAAVDSNTPRRGRWGARGISVSADEGVLEAQTQGVVNKNGTPILSNPGNVDLPTPGEYDLGDDEEEDDPPLPTNGHIDGVGNGSEWRDAGSK